MRNEMLTQYFFKLHSSLDTSILISQTDTRQVRLVCSVSALEVDLARFLDNPVIRTLNKLVAKMPRLGNAVLKNKWFDKV